MRNGAKHQREGRGDGGGGGGGGNNQNVAVHLAICGGSQRRADALQCGRQMRSEGPIQPPPPRAQLWEISVKNAGDRGAPPGTLHTCRERRG